MKSRTIAILVLVVLLTACARPKPQAATAPAGVPSVPPAATSTAMPAVPTASPVAAIPTSTAAPATATSVPAAPAPTATAVPAVPTASPVVPAPTSTTMPAAAPGASPPRPIVFPAGATNMTIQDQLAPGDTHHYVLRILAGQTLVVELPGLLGWAALAVRGADGTVLLSDRVGAVSWSGEVPRTQDYLVDVKSLTAAPTSYMLDVTIPPIYMPQATVVQFPPGGTSATVQGTLVPGAVDHYVLRVLAGQTLVLASAPGLQGMLALTVAGADGFVLLPESAAQASWRGQVPTTQDYYVDVRSIAGATFGYALQISVPALATPQPQPRRISFPAGGTSATVSGTLAPFSTDSYVLTVLAGQTLNVDVPGLQGKVLLVIWGADGSVLLTDHAIASSFSGVVPSTQDYFIDVRTSTTPVAYTMHVSVPPLSAPEPLPERITFQAGAISATVRGTLAANASARYILKAQAGQTLNAEASTTLGQVILIIWGADGTVLLTDHAGSHSFGGPLPITQDYYIAVRAVGAGPARYSLLVTIPPR